MPAHSCLHILNVCINLCWLGGDPYFTHLNYFLSGPLALCYSDLLRNLAKGFACQDLGKSLKEQEKGGGGEALRSASPTCCQVPN